MNSRLNRSLDSTSDLGQEIPCIALPEPNLSMEQDSEWCVIQDGDEWRQIRFHDYSELYAISGLYERLFYDILKCNSPTVVRKLLEEQLVKTGQDASELRFLDVGAGNGMVGEELADLGVSSVVGIDIIEEALLAAERDRPSVYEDYLVADLTSLSEEERCRLADHEFNGLTCVAALGFGDIPTAAFQEAYNLVDTGGWIAFNIKEDFLTDQDPSGFSGLIRRMIEEGLLSVFKQKRYQHRIATNGDPLFYVAIVGRKRGDIRAEWVE